MVGVHIRAFKGGRWNHAIDCGDETVIHLAVDGAAASRVRRSYRPDFVAGAEVVEIVTHRQRTFPATEVVARAYSRISDPGLAAMFRDSEAFAEWCVTGRLTAPQNTAVLEPDAPPAPVAARGGSPTPPQAPPAPARRPARAKAVPRAKRAPAAKAKGAARKPAPARAKNAAKAAARTSARKGARARAAPKGAPDRKARPAAKAAKKAAARRARPARRGGAKR